MPDVELPWFCLTCGYGEVPGEDFNVHECDEFRALPAGDRAKNNADHRAEIERRVSTKAPKAAADA